MIVYETSRLQLKTWELTDFDDFAIIARDPRVMQFIADGKPWPDSRIGWFMGIQKALQDSLGYCNWKLVHRASDELIGFCGLAPFPPAGASEIGWWIKPSHWGHGYAFEAAKHVMDDASADHHLQRLVARAYSANTRSTKLMERLGMRYDSILDTNSIGKVVLYAIDLPVKDLGVIASA